MSRHSEHNACEHELRYCRPCDIVACDKCSTEWGGKRDNYPSWPIPRFEYRMKPSWEIPSTGTPMTVEQIHAYTPVNTTGHTH